MTDLRDALLTAHVNHELSRFRGAAFGALIEERIATGFEWLEGVKVNDVVTRERIIGVIQRYVIELRVSGGITELAGQMANVVFSSKTSAATQLGDIFEPTSYEEFTNKIVTLEGAQREIIRYLTQSSAFGTLASRVVSRVVLDLLFKTDDSTGESRLKELLVSFGHKVLPGFDRRIGAALSRYIEHHASRFTRDGEKHLVQAADKDWVRQTADEIWDTLSKRRLSEVATVFTAQDLEDFVVLVYEYWMKFRKTPYFLAVVTDVVDHLFLKYGDESIATLIADMGVTEGMVSSELRTFLEPVLDHAFATGFLEKELRALLEPFYGSPEFEAVIAVHKR